jgi:hypothetical protein
LGVAAVAAVGLGVAVAVAGVDKAAGLAGVIVGFCELGALMLGVVGWVGQQRAAAGTPGPEVAAVSGSAAEPKPPTAQPATYVVDARQAQGVQTGEGNTQHNDYR